MLNGIQYDELSMAIAAASSGDAIEIYKSIIVPKTIVINSGKNVVLKLVRGVTVTINGYFMVTNGSLTIIGEGTVKEATPYFAPVILKNTDKNISADVYIGSDITLWGWAGLMFDGKSVNLKARCYGHVIGNNDGSDDGAGVYCNGNVLQASMTFVGSTEGLLALACISLAILILSLIILLSKVHLMVLNFVLALFIFTIVRLFLMILVNLL